MARDLAVFTETPVPVLTPRSFTFHNAATVSRQWEHKRLALLRGLSAGEVPFLVATVEGLLQRTLPPAVLEECCISLKVGESHDLNELAEKLVDAGYSRCDQVEGVGQFALRGGILDVYAPGMDRPARIEFFGDEVDAMGVFDLSTQRRVENVEEHSYEVAVLAHALAVIGRDLFGKDVSPDRAAAAALFHDAPEIITGDLPTPIKYNNPELKSAYGHVETVAQEKLLSQLPESLRGSYAPLITQADETVHRYVKAADKLAAWLKCQEELKAGNREFSRAADETLASLRAMQLEEADYFLEHFGEAFRLTLDDLG